jgi:hypothetical protein
VNTSASVAELMRRAAVAWADCLTPAQRRLAVVRGPADDDPSSESDRVRWFYTPTDHGGLPLGSQRPEQQGLAMRLVASGLSEAGYNAVATVMGLENVLDRLEGWSRDWGRARGRDPGLYWLRVFGEPTASGCWGWRFGGHHVSLNYLVADGEVVATTPSFLGADPARSPLPGGGELRPLGGAEELARQLMHSVDRDQRTRALLLDRAPSDIISGNRSWIEDPSEMLHMHQPALWQGPFAQQRLRDLVVEIDRQAEGDSGYDTADHRQLALRPVPRGLEVSAMDDAQQQMLRRLLQAHQGRVAEGVQPDVEHLIAGRIRFAWAGPTEPGGPHYYRVHGPGVLIEYDNTQRSANHAHSVWRVPENDFGRAVLSRQGGAASS